LVDTIVADYCPVLKTGSPDAYSPLPDGRVEFRYLDTRDHEKQWHRTVDAKDALPRMLSFLGQLHWFSVEQLQP